ncbi:MAG: ribokinase [Candidatus Binatia bacterium]
MISPTATAGQILVIGSLNVDLVMHAPRLPQPGETVTGAWLQIAAGGKGANQAVAAARLGAAVSMIGRIGADASGQLVRSELTQAGVNVEHVRVDPEAATGTAQIVVDATGQNAIVVASGANARLEVADVVHAGSAWSRAAAVVLQLEVPLATVAAAVAMARARSVPVLLNAAPAHPLPNDLLHALDWLIVNEVEAEQLVSGVGARAAVRSPADAFAAAVALRQEGQHVVVTLGAAGAVLAGARAPLHVPAPRIDVVDTTAAGDALVGALAAALLHGLNAEDALRAAVLAGSLACTRSGAIPSLPTVAEVQAARGS